MEIPVLVEPVPGNGFRARGGEPFALTAEGPTREEAVSRLEGLFRERMAAGARLVSIEIPATSNPWLAFAGVLKDEPLFDEWQEAIAERRRALDEELDLR